MKTTAFERFAGLSAMMAAVSGLLYSVAFIFIARSAPALGDLLSSLFLLLSGLFSGAALMGLYLRVRHVEPGFALLALTLALAGALGATIHGGYTLATALNQPTASALGGADLPNPVDPRGLLTFGLAGLALLVFPWLMGQGGGFSRGLRAVGYGLAILLVIIYLARLIVLQATNPVLLIPALLAGFIVSPLWYFWLGAALWRGAGAPEAAPARSAGAVI